MILTIEQKFELEQKIKTALSERGFPEKVIRNKRGLIGATIEETIIALNDHIKKTDNSPF